MFTMFQSHRPLYLVVGLLAASLLLVACDDDPVSDDPEDPEPSVTASFTIDPDEPEIGDEVTLDASNSSAQNAGDLSFEWSLTAPSGSDASLADTGAEVTTFTADVEGDYDVALEVSANGASDSDNQSVTALETAGVVELSSSIDEDRTLNAETLYLVTSRIDINALLTVEPGTQIEFERDTYFQVNSDGALDASGTETDPIVFTSVQPGDTREPGFWNGLFFESSERIENTLDHVIVEYGGGEGLGFRNDVGANVTVARSGSDARVAITNTTLRHSGEYGLRVYHSGELLDFSNNELTENEVAAASLFPTNAHQIDGSSTYTGNTNDVVEIDERAVDTSEIAWKALDVPYQMNGHIRIEEDTDLTIEPGAEFHFERGGQLTFNDESVARIEGTEEDPIVFTSVQSGDTREPGFWNGLFFQSTERAENILDHAVVEYGGNESVGFRTDPANVTVARNGRDARLTITNTTLRESRGYGLFVHSNGTINSDWRDANTFERNADGPGGGGGTD